MIPRKISGVKKISASQLRTQEEIDAWAERSCRDHRKICQDHECGGRRKIWWHARHKKVSSRIKNEAVLHYVTRRLMVCEPLLRQLVEKRILWLPGERDEYSRRTPEEVASLLGRAYPIGELPPDTGKLTTAPLPVPPRPKTGRPTKRAVAERQRAIAAHEMNKRLDAYRAQRMAETEPKPAAETDQPWGPATIVSALHRKAF